MQSIKKIWLGAIGATLVTTLTSRAQMPPNDAFANRTVLSGENITISTKMTGATLEPNDPAYTSHWFSAGVTGLGSLWWSWTAPITGYAILEGKMANFPTTRGAYPDFAVFPTDQIFGLNFIADNIATIHTDNPLFVAFPIVAGQTYSIEQIAVADAFQSTDYTFHLRYAPTPIIFKQPQSLDIAAGDPALFTVLAPGISRFGHFQWQHNGIDIPGATGVALQINNVTPAHAGDYRVFVNTPNPTAITISQIATLTVQGVNTSPELRITKIPDSNQFQIETAGEEGQGILFRHSTTLTPFSTDNHYGSYMDYLFPHGGFTLTVPESPTHFFFAWSEGNLRRTCVANLHRIEFGKELWRIDNHKWGGQKSTEQEVDAYFGGAHPRCPVGGGIIYGANDTPVTCSITGHAYGNISYLPETRIR